MGLQNLSVLRYEFQINGDKDSFNLHNFLAVGFRPSEKSYRNERENFASELFMNCLFSKDISALEHLIHSINIFLSFINKNSRQLL